MMTKALPAISSAFAPLGVPKVFMQHDGAPAHMGKDVEAEINASGATLCPPVEVVPQPSQSPHTNLCDLSFFRALAAGVAKRRRGLDRQRLQFNIHRLVEDVHAAYKDYSVEKIEEMCAYKSVVMSKIIACDGGNHYSKRRDQTSLPIKTRPVELIVVA